jgi:hypothetical protein
MTNKGCVELGEMATQPPCDQLMLVLNILFAHETSARRKTAATSDARLKMGIDILP